MKHCDLIRLHLINFGLQKKELGKVLYDILDRVCQTTFKTAQQDDVNTIAASGVKVACKLVSLVKKVLFIIVTFAMLDPVYQEFYNRREIIPGVYFR